MTTSLLSLLIVVLTLTSMLHGSLSSSTSSTSSSLASSSLSLSSPNNNNEYRKAEEEELISKLETSVHRNNMIVSLGKLKEEISIKSRATLLSKAAMTGIIAGIGVSAFKLSIDEVRKITHGSLIENNIHLPSFLIPTLGGLAVSIILVLSKGDAFTPGLTGVIKEVDLEVETFYSSSNSNSDSSSVYEIKTKMKYLVRIYQKMLAAIITLGTGKDLDVDVHMSMSM